MFVPVATILWALTIFFVASIIFLIYEILDCMRQKIQAFITGYMQAANSVVDDEFSTSKQIDNSVNYQTFENAINEIDE